MEIPEGSIPVKTLYYTKSHNMFLKSFTTDSITFYFYFPSKGKFGIYPANVSRRGKVVAQAVPTAFEVLTEKKNIKLETMADILS